MCFVTFQISTTLPQWVSISSLSSPHPHEARRLLSAAPCIASSCIWGRGSCSDVLMLPLSTVPGDPLLRPCFLQQRTRGGDWRLGRKSPGPLNVNYHADKSQHYSYCPWPGPSTCTLLHYTQLLMIAVADCSATLASALRLTCCNTGGGLLETQLWMWRFRDEEI